MKKLKVVTILGTRPEIIKLSMVIRKCEKYFEHVLVHTGQNYDYELNQIFFEELGIKEPDYYLNVVGEHLGETMGNIVGESYELLNKVKPDAVLILGDTNSGLSAISAKRLKIPVFHLEAGNRCFDENLPEEINRRIIDHISDINMCYSEHARRNLIGEGRPAAYTFVVGSPMAEIFQAYEKIEESSILDQLELAKEEYILLSVHREENIDNEVNFLELFNSLNALASYYKKPIIYSVHPRSKKRLEESGFELNEHIKELKPFGFFDYIMLQKNALCVISDSGTLAEESAFYNFPAVSVRTSTERQEAIDSGTMILGSINKGSVIDAVNLVVNMHSNHELGASVVDYEDTNMSTKVIKIIQGYTEIINRMVWRK